jgi:hypothetical protein
MRMPIAGVLCLLLQPFYVSAAPLSKAAAQWRADIAVLADDRMEGRQTGSAAYLRAADYVVSRLEAEGLEPAGVNGFLQPVMLEQQVVDQRASTLDLVDAQGAVTPLRVGEISRISPGGAPLPATLDAPRVFVGKARMTSPAWISKARWSWS